jgi:hypothetical protein
MKPLFVISCPFDTYSGYGARARDIVKSIIELDKYDVRLLSQRWGNTPFGFCEDHPEWKFLLNRTLPNNQLPKQPDVWMQITVPNEFQPVGKYNIGCTAGMETTLVHGTWVEGMNRMDINFVSSEHSKKAFLDSKFQKQENGRVIGNVEVQKPIEVLFEGANLDIYKPTTEPCMVDFDIPESFAYLFVGHWMQGDLGEDRKNVGLLIHSFYETFKNKKKTPALILKCSGAGSSYMDRDEILKKIKAIKSNITAETLPNIYLLHGEFSDQEINDLYNHKKVKAMVSLTKGEGFGRPLLEFSLTKKPIITTNWSGHIDFLDSKFTTLLSGEVKQVHPSAAIKDMILQESAWFAPNISEFSHHLTNMFTNYKSYEKGAMLQYHKSKNNFSFKGMVEVLELLLDRIPEFPKPVKLKLPKVKKIELPKTKQLENVER